MSTSLRGGAQRRSHRALPGLTGVAKSAAGLGTAEPRAGVRKRAAVAAAAAAAALSLRRREISCGASASRSTERWCAAWHG